MPSVTNGFKFSSTEQLVVSSGPIFSWAGGLPFDATGALVVTTAVPLANDPYVGGVRVGANGVYVTTDAPPLLAAFTHGFDGGFDAG